MQPTDRLTRVVVVKGETYIYGQIDQGGGEKGEAYIYELPPWLHTSSLASKYSLQWEFAE